MKRKKGRRCSLERNICLLLFGISAAMLLWAAAASRNFPAQDALGSPEGTFAGRKGEEPADKVDLTCLYSPHAILIELSSNRIIAENQSADRIYPASLTKIMTALLVVESGLPLDELRTMPEKIYPPLYKANAAMAGFLPGEEVSLRDLLYGMMLPSGAECAVTLARVLGGTERDFSMQMNQRAEALGMKNTHFCNSTGLHQRGHISSVEDLALLVQAALKNPEFREVFTSTSYRTSTTEIHPEGILLQSSMFSKMDTPQLECGKILGGKTGYTGEAGLCLVSLAEIDGEEYLLVTAGAEGSHSTAPLHILDACNVYTQIGKILS